ncbi:cupin domain-containing protein [Labrys monachus]|uniref:Uncharacterized protein YjlB n=1 Tax=Labrys monachus TaxID=217067 RepID=A0ABU0F6T6_9HYPH|nr:cupin domain-containing protein [Labrys monachus]MDQ0390325.1 uncharacterized protein YjlB [Labrys monachus]
MVDALHFGEAGPIPNNPDLPVLVYRGAFGGDTEDMARAMEERFAANGWPPQWRNGIYAFHHYHCGGHEVLGIAAGEAEVTLGGEGGRTLPVRKGDVLLLPAGTGHRRVTSSADFLVVGAYPPGQEGDIQRDAATPGMKRRIAALPPPEKDPVSGAPFPQRAR